MPETRVTMPDGSVVTFPEGMDDAAITSALTARRAQGVPGSSANTMSAGDWGRAGFTAAVRGITGLGEILADPLAPIRALAYPKLAEMERREKAGAVVPPPGEIAYRVGTGVFDVTEVPEYQPTTPQGRIGMAAAQGAIGGGGLGAGGALLRTGRQLAPLAGSTGLNATLGSVSGTAGQTTQEATGSERLGILASLVPGGAITAAGLKARPRLTPDMEAAGINPTFGQAMGGWLNRIEQGVGSVPYFGDFIKTGRAGAVEQFNTGAIDQRVLAPIGERLNPDTPSGREAIAEAVDRVGARYDTVTPHLSATPDQPFGAAVTDVFRRSTMLSQAHQQQFANTFRTEILDRMPNGTLTGQAFRDAESTLGQMARNYRSSALASERDYGNLLLDLQTELRALGVRRNPDHAAELQNINTAYSNLTRIEKAATKPNAGIGGNLEYGNYTPGALQAATRELDPTLRHRSFARGDAILQDYAEQGRRLLGDTVPDSGTPYRSLIPLAGGAGAAGLISPAAVLGTLVGGGGLAAMYSPQGRAAMNYFLRRPGQALGTGLLAEPD
jgi:hypothetical protein